MKLTRILAAGLLIAGVGVSTAASAQPRSDYSQQYRGDRDDRGYDRRDDRRDDRHDRRWDRRHDNGNHYGWRNNRHRDCRIVYRHHQRVRVCR